jgi:hypothetical protein
MPYKRPKKIKNIKTSQSQTVGVKPSDGSEVYGSIRVSRLWEFSIGASQYLLKNELRIISGTWRTGEKPKPDFESTRKITFEMHLQ